MKWTARLAFATAATLTLALALGCGGDKKNNNGNGGGATVEIGTYGGTATVSYVKAGNDACVEFGPMEIPMSNIPMCSGNASDAADGQGLDDCTYNETSDGATYSCTGSQPFAGDPLCTEAYQASGSIEKLSSTKLRMTMDYKSTVSGPGDCADNTNPCTMHMVVTLERTSSTVDCTAAPRGVLDILRAQGFGGLR